MFKVGRTMAMVVGAGVVSSSVIAVSSGPAVAADPNLDAAWNDRLKEDPFHLFMAAVQWAPVDVKKAEELYTLGVARRHYDVARCKAAPHGYMSSGIYALRLSAGEALKQAGVTKASLALVRRMVEDGSAYSYEGADLEAICEGEGVKPESEWAAERQAMRDQVAQATSTAR